MPAFTQNRIRRCADRAQLSFYVETLLDACQLKDDPEGQPALEAPTMSVYTPQDMARFIEFWKDVRGDGGSNSQAVLKALEGHGPRWPCSPVPTIDELDCLEKAFPNFGEPIQEVRRATALASLSPGGSLALPPILLSGPPGIGKSRFARELSKALRVPLLSFAMSHSTASFSLGGLNSQYSGGGPGDLVRSFAQHGVPDLLVVVDEVDKAPADATHDPTGPLYDLLEADTAKSFVDDGFRMPLDLSGLRWICTCNDAALLAQPLRSRFVHFEIEPPTPQQMIRILGSAYAEILQRGRLERHFEPELPAAICQKLSNAVPRDIKRSLRAALGAAALEGRRTIRVTDLPIEPSSRAKRTGFF